MTLLKYHKFTIERRAASTKVKGIYTKGAITVISDQLGRFQPLALTEMGGETVEPREQGNNTREYKKLYTQVEVRKNDYITDARNGKKYRVMKVYHYEDEGLTAAQHYKCHLILEG